jgi:hypothetical protein
MNAIKTVLTVGLVSLAAFAAKAEEEVTLAWQTPGYVIEEIVVTAPRVASLPTDLRTPAARPAIPEPGQRRVNANRLRPAYTSGVSANSAESRLFIPGIAGFFSDYAFRHFDSYGTIGLVRSISVASLPTISSSA